jgi:hypothetical protein
VSVWQDRESNAFEQIDCVGNFRHDVCLLGDLENFGDALQAARK